MSVAQPPAVQYTPRQSMGSQASAEARTALDAIRRLVRLLRESSREAEKRAGIPGAQLFVLQQLREGAALSLRELAERTLTHESSVSVVAQRLADKGLVARSRSPDDGRRRRLALTPSGRALLRRAPRLAQEKLIAGIDALPRLQRRALAGSLQQLIAGLRLDRSQAGMFFEDQGGARGRK